MKTRLYSLLVNRQPGIKERYHNYHDGAGGFKKYISWLYLLWLNFGYYVLHLRFFGKSTGVSFYEEKVVLIDCTESACAVEKIGETKTFIDALSHYDTISFDIFDTLIFRPFSEPADLFYFLGEKLGIMNFKQLRMQAEQEARKHCHKENGHYEITLADIWETLEKLCGNVAANGMETEIQLEKQFCYANPFMKRVFEELQKQGKKIIIVSDMYLPAAVLEETLQANGYSGYDKLYASCEYGKNKAGGELYELVKRENPGRMVHVGDNEHSDVAMAKKAGIAAMHYPNVNRNALLYRPYDMSPMVGGAYRGIVNNRIYSGTEVYSQEYEYGFIYGGLFVTGYCAFIHEYCRKHRVDKVLFLSRDGDILKQVYDMLYPEENTEYVYWSRRAATKLMAGEDRYDYFRRFLYHKVNQNITVKSVLASMELAFLAEQLPKNISKEDELTDRNVDSLKDFLKLHWQEVLVAYRGEQKAAEQYYRKVLADCRHVVAVDIGWAGSGAVALNHLVQNVWKIPCEITGLIAGTNTIYNAEPEASETFLQSGKLVSYLYSQSFNRDLLKKHDPNRNYNVYWELLLSSPTPQFCGFQWNDKEDTVQFVFGEYDANQEGIKQVQQGILDFVTDYRNHFFEFDYMFHISGRDAYAPMLVAASKNEKYLKVIERKFALEKNVS